MRKPDHNAIAKRLPKMKARCEAARVGTPNDKVFISNARTDFPDLIAAYEDLTDTLQDIRNVLLDLRQDRIAHSITEILGDGKEDRSESKS